jgi:hypothetical protein
MLAFNLAIESERLSYFDDEWGFPACQWICLDNSGCTGLIKNMPPNNLNNLQRLEVSRCRGVLRICHTDFFKWGFTF